MSEQKVKELQQGEIEVIKIPLDKLDEPYFNYRYHPAGQIFNLALSLRHYGQRRTISVWAKEDGRYDVLAGNGITRAAREANFTYLSCTLAPADWDELTRKAYAVADNQGGYEDDLVKLAEIYEEIRNDSRLPLESLGTNSEKVNQLLDSLARDIAGPEPTSYSSTDFHQEQEIDKTTEAIELSVPVVKYMVVVGDLGQEEAEELAATIPNARVEVQMPEVEEKKPGRKKRS